MRSGTRIQLDRVIAVTADFDGERQLGSGFLVAPRLVLTAWHCTVHRTTGAEASGLTLLRLGRPDTVAAVCVATSRDLDLAVLALPEDCDWGVDLPRTTFGRTDPLVSETLTDCQAVGLPAWQHDEDLRSSGTVQGSIRTGDGLGTGLWQLRDLETRGVADPSGSTTTQESPWAGLSGALVFQGTTAIGVVLAHKQWLADAITVRPIATLFPDGSPNAIATALGLSGLGELARIGNDATHSTPKVPHWALSAAHREALLRLRKQAFIRCEEEVGVLGVGGRAPMPVRWTTADRDLTDDPVNIFPEVGLRSVEGSAADIGLFADIFRSLPRRRLVVVGPPGAGKTVFAQLLMRELLSIDEPDQPVAIWLTASSWDVDAFPTLRQFLRSTLQRHYPALAASPELLKELIDYRLVVPVIDGLDEVAPSAQDKLLRALDRDLTERDALILTCRHVDYRELVSRTSVLTAAAVIQAQPLTPVDAEQYLRPLVQRHRASWDALLATLAADSNSPISGVCTTPLGLWLLRVSYLDAPRDPTLLLDADRFPDSASIRSALLDGLVAAVIETRRPNPEDPADTLRPRREWEADKARRWLAFLARELHESRDLRWWQPAQPYTPRWLAKPLVFLLDSAFFVLGGTLAFIVGAVALIAVEPPGYQMIVAGLLVAAYCGVLAWRVRMPREPRAPREGGLGAHVLTNVFTEHSRWDYLMSFAAGPVFGAIWAFRTDHSAYGRYMLWGLILGPPAIVVMLTAGALYRWVLPDGDSCTCRACAAAADHSSRTPWSSFVDSRRRIRSIVGYAAGGGLLCGAVLVVVVAAIARMPFSPQALWVCGRVVLTAVGIGVFVGLLTAVVSEAAWLSFRVNTAVLALRGRLPLKTMSFLQDMHRIGLLRTAGMVYQFRHAEFQDCLAPIESWPDQKRAEMYRHVQRHAVWEDQWAEETRVRNEAELVARTEAVEMFEPLAAVDPGRHGRSRAEALERLATQHKQMKNYPAALVAARTAQEQWAELAELGHDVDFDIGYCHRTLTELHNELGDSDRAAAAALAAVEAFTPLAAAAPLDYVGWLCRALHDYRSARFPDRGTPLDDGVWLAAADAMTDPWSRGCVHASLARAWSEQECHAAAERELGTALTLVASPMSDPAEELAAVGEARRTIRREAYFVVSHRNSRRRNKRFWQASVAEAELPPWVRELYPYRAGTENIALARAFVSAVDRIELARILLEVPVQSSALVADISLLAQLYPTEPRLVALAAIVEDATLDPTLIAKCADRVRDAAKADSASAWVFAAEVNSVFLRETERDTLF